MFIVKRSLFIFGFILMLCASQNSCTSSYLGRLIIWNIPDFDDHKKFPTRTIECNTDHIEFENINYPEFFQNISYKKNNVKVSYDFDDFLEMNETTSFIVIRDDTILYEKYFNGTIRQTLNPTFSASKSITSILVGIAISEGKITSLYDPVVKYIPELKKQQMDSVTIYHLLTMTSGIDDKVGDMSFSANPRAYYSPNIMDDLFSLKLNRKPGKEFLYNDYNTKLLGVILQRVTGKDITEYTEEKLWKPIGAEYNAVWTLHSEEQDLEHMSSGLHARPIDLAKIGMLYLKNGFLNNSQIVPSEWVTESTIPDTVNQLMTKSYKWPFFYNYRYKYHWWNVIRDSTYVYTADGMYGQYIFVYPKKKVVIVRNGLGAGELSSYQWAMLHTAIAEHITK